MQEVLKTKTSLNILKKHARWVSGILRVFDFCLIFISGLLAFFVKFGLANFPAEFYLEAMVLGGLLGLFSFQFLGVYSPLRGRKLIQQLRQLFFAWLLLTLMLSLLAFFTKTGGNFSRQWLFEWMLLGLVLSSLARAGLVWGLSFFRGLGYNTRSIVILGSGELARKMAEKLNQDKSMGYQLVSFLDRESFLKNKNIKE